MDSASEGVPSSGDYHHPAGLTEGFREHLREPDDECCALGLRGIYSVSEISPLKIGRILPGVHLPVVSQQEPRGSEQPDSVELFSWHILDEPSSPLREEGFRGKFIVPLSEPHVLTEL